MNSIVSTSTDPRGYPVEILRHTHDALDYEYPEPWYSVRFVNEHGESNVTAYMKRGEAEGMAGDLREGGV